MENLFSLKNKIVLITGAGRGIGEHLAGKLAQQGAFVYAVDIKFTSKSNLAYV